MVSLQVIVTSYLTVSILVASPEHRIRDQCLGNYMIHYTRYFHFFTFFSLNFMIYICRDARAHIRRFQEYFNHISILISSSTLQF